MSKPCKQCGWDRGHAVTCDWYRGWDGTDRRTHEAADRAEALEADAKQWEAERDALAKMEYWCQGCGRWIEEAERVGDSHIVPVPGLNGEPEPGQCGPVVKQPGLLKERDALEAELRAAKAWETEVLEIEQDYPNWRGKFEKLHDAITWHTKGQTIRIGRLDAECRRLRELLERGLTILRSYLKADPSDAIGDKETELYRQASHFEAEAYGALAPQARGREQAPPEAQGREEVGVAEREPSWPCPECDKAGRLDQTDRLFKSYEALLAAGECKSCHGRGRVAQQSGYLANGEATEQGGAGEGKP